MTTTTTDVQFPGLVSGTWTIDPSHSEVGFTVRHLMSKVRGLFTSFEGELHISDNPLESNGARHHRPLVGRHPQRRPRHPPPLRRLLLGGGGQHDDVHHHRPVGRRRRASRRPATSRSRASRSPSRSTSSSSASQPDPWGNTRVGLEAKTSISRKEWGVSFNIPLEGDKLLIGDTVNVVIAIEAVRQA